VLLKTTYAKYEKLYDEIFSFPFGFFLYNDTEE